MAGSVAKTARVALASIGGLAVTALVGFIGLVIFWAAIGGRWFVVESPSMGQAAPVGTLIWTEPVAMTDLRAGDLVTFRPPGSAMTYTHRVVQLDPDGSLQTRGDVNRASDPWRINQSEIVGRVVMRWWGIGWLIKAAPILILGGLLLWLLVAGFTPALLKLPIALLGAAVIVTIAIVVVRPLIGAAQVSFVPTADGARATYVATGLLPVRMSGLGAPPVSLADGAVGSLVTTHPVTDSRYQVQLTPDVPWWFWLIVVLACLTPAAASTATQLRRPAPA